MRTANPLLLNAPSPWLVHKDAKATKDDKRTAYGTTYFLSTWNRKVESSKRTNDVPGLTEPLDSIPEPTMWLCHIQYKVEKLNCSDDRGDDDRNDSENNAVIADCNRISRQLCARVH